MALKSLIQLGHPEQRLAVYTVTSPAVCKARTVRLPTGTLVAGDKVC